MSRNKGNKHEQDNSEAVGEEVLDALEQDASEAEQEAPAEEVKREFHLLNGEKTSRTGFIKEQFLELNKTKKAISVEFEIDYRSVYQATINLTNEAETSSGGNRARVFIEIEGVSVCRNDFIVELAEGGMSRSDIVAKLSEITGEEVKYQVVYNATKGVEGMESTRGAKIMVKLEDGSEISRSDFIKMRHAEGKSVSDIAKELKIAYQAVYSVIGSKTKAKVTIKANTVAELDEKFAEARLILVAAEEAAAALAASEEDTPAE